MYIPRLNQMADIDTMIAFMEKNNFAILISAVDSVPMATQLPFTITGSGDNLRLRCHFAKANPHWKSISQGEILVVFSGPHAYISPTHYDAFESVPTWNYMTVHAHGKARLIDFSAEPEALEAMLIEMIDAHEPNYKNQWDQLSQRYKDGMKQGIVGVEIDVTRLEGKAKLSQNKTFPEQERIAESLISHTESHIVDVGYAMKENNQAG